MDPAKKERQACRRVPAARGRQAPSELAPVLHSGIAPDARALPRHPRKGPDHVRNGTRKTHSEKRRRTFQVKVRFTPDEHAHLLNQARITNKSPTMLTAAVAGVRLKPVTKYPHEVFRAIIGLSRNFNQLVKKLHATSQLGRPKPES